MPNKPKKEGGRSMKNRAFLPIIAITVIALVVAGFTGQKNKLSSPQNPLEKRIAALETEIASLKAQLSKGQSVNDKLGTEKGESEPFVGPRVWTEGTQGWVEDGVNMWTAQNYNVGINKVFAPTYPLDVTGDVNVDGDLRVLHGIYDGASLGSANQVLVADGAGGVEWGGSPAGVADYIWNQDTAAQDISGTGVPANFWIGGTGRADYSLIGISSVDSDFGVLGWSAAATGNGQGIWGESSSDIGFGGVFIGGNAGTWYSITGEDAAVSGTGMAYGVIGWGYDATVGDEGIGVLGVGDVQAATGVTMYSGSGVCGYSESFNGVFGFTPADTAFGVYGYNSGVGGTGVFGVGNGIAGTYWGGSGVSGASDDVGVFGYGDATSQSWGVCALSDATDGYGVYAEVTAATGFGVRAHNDDASGTGLNASGNGETGYYFTGGSGAAGTGTSFGVAGFCTADGGRGIYGYSLSPTNSGAGTYGFHSHSNGTGVVGLGNGGGSYVTLTVGTGGAFTGDTIGVAGFSYGSSGNVAGGYFDNFNGPLGSFCYTAYEFGGIDYKVIGSGIAATIMETREGNKTLFCPESPEAWFEDIGEAQLQNGRSGKITLDPLFLDCIVVDEDHPLKVFVQLRGDCNGVYVKTYNDGFEVIELQNGTSDAKFCYRVIGSWKDYEDARFPNAPLRLTPKATSVAKDIPQKDTHILESNNIKKHGNRGTKISIEKLKTIKGTKLDSKSEFGKSK